MSDPLRVERMIVLPADPDSIAVQFNRPISQAEVGQLRELLDNWLSFAIPEPSDKP